MNNRKKGNRRAWSKVPMLLQSTGQSGKWQWQWQVAKVSPIVTVNLSRVVPLFCYDTSARAKLRWGKSRSTVSPKTVNCHELPWPHLPASTCSPAQQIARALIVITEIKADGREMFGTGPNWGEPEVGAILTGSVSGFLPRIGQLKSWRAEETSNQIMNTLSTKFRYAWRANCVLLVCVLGCVCVWVYCGCISLRFHKQRA